VFVTATNGTATTAPPIPAIMPPAATARTTIEEAS
jgi:hypothetical protein